MAAAHTCPVVPVNYSDRAHAAPLDRGTHRVSDEIYERVLLREVTPSVERCLRADGRTTVHAAPVTE